MKTPCKLWKYHSQNFPHNSGISHFLSFISYNEDLNFYNNFYKFLQ